MDNTAFFALFLIILSGVLVLLAAIGIQYQLRKISRAVAVLDRADVVELTAVSPANLGYMCRIDFEAELGLADGGNIVFASPEDCSKHRQCAASCGIVEVEVRYVRTVLEGSKFDGTDPLEEDAEEPT